jgi:hypothetical protein
MVNGIGAAVDDRSRLRILRMRTVVAATAM